MSGGPDRLAGERAAILAGMRRALAVLQAVDKPPAFSFDAANDDELLLAAAGLGLETMNDTVMRALSKMPATTAPSALLRVARVLGADPDELMRVVAEGCSDPNCPVHGKGKAASRDPSQTRH